MMDDMDLAVELLRQVRDCFFKRGRWWEHKSNESGVVDVSEDLHDTLEEVEEFLAGFPE